MDKSQQYAQQIQQQLLKSTKEHIDKQTERLLNYFGEEFKFTDPLNLVGKRFKDKEAEFQAMKQNNNQLFIKTRNLAEELEKLRGSLNKSQYDEMHISLDKTEKIQNMASSKIFGRTLASDNSQILQKMKDLHKTIEVARQDYNSYAQEYDQLLQYLFSYISRQKNIQKLHSQAMRVQEQKEGNSNQERILVPKKRYEKLIQIYAINMADISVNEFRKQIKSSNNSKSNQFENKAINYEEQSKRLYKQNYADIARDENIDTKDLYLLFRALARKIGLQRQWQRYHLQNTKQAIQFKSKIQNIFKQSSEIDEDIKDGQIPKPINDKELIDKVNKVISEIAISLPEKQRWLTIKKKIDEDRLINMEKVAQEFQKMIKLKDSQIIEKISLVINTTITKSLQSFSKLIETKLRAKGARLGQRLQEINVDNLKKAIEDKFEPSKMNLWQVCSEIVNQKIEQIFKKLTKNILFISSGSLYQSLILHN